MADVVSMGSAQEWIAAYLGRYGLPSTLGDWVWSRLQDGWSVEEIGIGLMETPEYKERFPAMEELAKRGQAISTDQYISYERELANLNRAMGIPGGIFDTREYVRDLMLANVSLREYEERAQINRDAALQAPAEVRQAFSEMYGMGSEGAMTAYFMDPDQSLPVIRTRYQAAQIAAEAIDQQVTYDRDLAERLALQGVSAQQARTGFQQVAATRALGAGVGGETTSEAQRTAAAFGDQEARRQQERVQASRQAQFGGAQQGATQAGVSGLGSSAS